MPLEDADLVPVGCRARTLWAVNALWDPAWVARASAPGGLREASMEAGQPRKGPSREQQQLCRPEMGLLPHFSSWGPPRSS